MDIIDMLGTIPMVVNHTQGTSSSSPLKYSRALNFGAVIT